DGNLDEAKKILKEVSSFKNKNGEEIEGVNEVNELKGTRLNIVHHKIKEMKERKEKEAKKQPVELVKNLVEELKKRGFSENGILTFLKLEGNLKIETLKDLENLNLNELRETYKLLRKELDKKK
ncbi:MAG: hypothetical protein RMJ67_09045, partial [Elusimicrobiota bacterium]|nr:hypothetical protein [Endomicrobiia bacterium]MDW8166643.1 hypothetical protein [Elusimicrobiota bacterium]